VRVILFGATGMVGQGVLRECVLDHQVDRVRSASRTQPAKVKEIVHADLFDLSAIADQLSGYDACFFCLGVSAVGMRERA
jgi:putative NADH-flavin reductase